MRSAKQSAAPLALFMLLAVACSPSDHAPLEISELKVFEPVGGRAMGVGYMTLNNNTAADVSITRVTSPQFAAVKIHQTVIEDGVARMRAVPELVIPANASITLQQGGLHLMLMQPVARIGDVRLSFYDGKTVLLETTTRLQSRNR